MKPKQPQPIYVDTVKLLDNRFSLMVVLRLDYYHTDYEALAVATNATTLAITKTPTHLKARYFGDWKVG